MSALMAASIAGHWLDRSIRSTSGHSVGMVSIHGAAYLGFHRIPRATSHAPCFQIAMCYDAFARAVHSGSMLSESCSRPTPDHNTTTDGHDRHDSPSFPAASHFNTLVLSLTSCFLSNRDDGYSIPSEDESRSLGLQVQQLFSN